MKRNYLAMKAAHSLQAELWYDLPESERTEAAKLLLEQYLTASDMYCLIHNLTGQQRIAYIRRRSAQYYQDNYYLAHHTWTESIRIRSKIEIALIDTMGASPADAIYLGFWHGVRLSGAIYQANNLN